MSCSGLAGPLLVLMLPWSVDLCCMPLLDEGGDGEYAEPGTAVDASLLARMSSIDFRRANVASLVSCDMIEYLDDPLMASGTRGREEESPPGVVGWVFVADAEADLSAWLEEIASASDMVEDAAFDCCVACRG
jgi:hypothetical protein